MRKYAALYHKVEDKWSIIFQDDYEDEWYIEIDNLGSSKETATKVADALNQANRPRDTHW